MLLTRKGTYKIQHPHKDVPGRFGKAISADTRYALHNLNSLKPNSFRLKYNNELFVPFGRKILLADIKGKIDSNRIEYEVSISHLMGGILMINVFVVLCLSIMFLSSEEYIAGMILIVFVLAIVGFVNFRLKKEIAFLERSFLEILSRIL